jgi:hypothetical protein
MMTQGQNRRNVRILDGCEEGNKKTKRKRTKGEKMGGFTNSRKSPLHRRVQRQRHQEPRTLPIGQKKT